MKHPYYSYYVRLSAHAHAAGLLALSRDYPIVSMGYCRYHANAIIAHRDILAVIDDDLGSWRIHDRTSNSRRRCS
jgi:hypothetical protein